MPRRQPDPHGLAAGQSWHEHHSVHPVFVQVLKGEVTFHVKDRDITLVPGKPISR